MKGQTTRRPTGFSQALEELGFEPMAIFKAYGALSRAFESGANSIGEAVKRAVAEMLADPHVMSVPKKKP